MCIYMRFSIYSFIGLLSKLPFLPYFLFSLPLLPVCFLFSVFPVSDNLLARFPSQAVGETVTEL